MKILFVGFIAGVIFILSNKHHVTDGQFFPDHTIYYVPIEFDTVNRGLWNASDCLRDLLNCWESTRPDMLCSYDKYKTSICEYWRDNCDDETGMIDDPSANTLFERWCQDREYQRWTK